MTNEDIVGQALVAGFMIHSGYGQHEHQLMPASDTATLLDFARAIEAKVREECKTEWQKGFDEGTIAGYESGQTDMREECAVICEEIDTDCHSEEVIAMTCAEAIRGRGKE